MKYIFKGFKRSGNHLVIFNIIDNIINGDTLNAIGTFLFYNHEHKLIYVNCPNSRTHLYSMLLSGDRSNVQAIIDTFKEQAPLHDIESIRDFMYTDITDDYTILFSFEDAGMFEDDSKIVEQLVGACTYKTVFIVRDIKNMYSSRKKTGWMSIGQGFIDQYKLFANMTADMIIKFDDYVMSDEYRSVKHSLFGVNTNTLFPKDYLLPIGESSFANSDGIFDRTYTLDDDDLNLLNQIL